MIAALTLMCAMSATECRTSDAQVIADAIDGATDDDRLRSVMVVYSHLESRWHLNPKPFSRDAKEGRSCGPLQQDCQLLRSVTLKEAFCKWLDWVQMSSIGSVDSSPSRAFGRLCVAREVLKKGREQ